VHIRNTTSNILSQLIDILRQLLLRYF